MSDKPDEHDLFSDPTRMIADGRIAAQARKRQLGQLFSRPPEPSADDRLDAEQLDAVADAVADRVVSRLDPAA